MIIKKKPRRKCIFAHNSATIYRPDSPPLDPVLNQNLNLESKNNNDTLQDSTESNLLQNSENSKNNINEKSDNVSPIRI